MQALQTQLFLEIGDALRELLVLGLQHSDLGRVRRDQRLQRLCRGLAIYRILKLKPTPLVNNLGAISAHALILPSGVAPHGLDVDAFKQPVQLFGR